MEVKFSGCDQDLLPEGEECAPLEDVNNKYINLDGMQSFVDFSEADPDKVKVQERTR